MKKVLIGKFMTESNELVDEPITIDRFVLKSGIEIAEALQVSDVFDEGEIELIPTLYANGESAGQVEEYTFEYILKAIEKVALKHRKEIDGVYMSLHGASKIENMPTVSGEEAIVKMLRKVLGPNVPIAVVADPHGNLSEEYVNECSILRSYRESPHIDEYETHKIVAQMLIEHLNNQTNIKPAYRFVPIMLGGERSVSKDEPVRSINQLMDEYEEDSRIMSCSYHIGYMRHDSYNSGAGIVVVPSHIKYSNYAEEVADQLYKYVIDKRREFTFTGNTKEEDDAIQELLLSKEKLNIMSDSGDNITSGAAGYNTHLLIKTVEAYKKVNEKRKMLFAPIVDPIAAYELSKINVGDKIELKLGINDLEIRRTYKANVILKSIGDVVNQKQEVDRLASSYLVNIEGTNIDIIVIGISIPYVEINQYKRANINIHDYDFVVVKTGYMYPELAAIADFTVMALTDGTTLQKTELLTYRQIRRPMFPYDEIE